MKKVFLLSVLLLATYVGFSQTSIGVRGGASSIGDGLSIKHFVGNSAAIEGLVTLGDNHFAVAGIYELHQSLSSDLKGLFFEYGAGPYVGLYDNGANDEMHIGATGILGLEYRFSGIPFTVSLDYNPNLQIVNDIDIDFVDFSGSVRFVF